MPPPAAYILCTSPRSGSTLLCRMLAGTGRCGVPGSHFHDPSVAAWLADHGVPSAAAGDPRGLPALRAAVAAARAAGTDEAGMFGLRLQRHSADFFMAQIARLHPGRRGDRARIETAFGPTRFLYLRRASKLEQAISYIKAQQSGLWHRAPDRREIERLSPPARLRYDRGAIASQIAAFETPDRAWAAWFARERIAPLILSYEALAVDAADTVARVLAFLDVAPGAHRAPAVPLARLSDQVNRDWAMRFRAETGMR